MTHLVHPETGPIETDLLNTANLKSFYASKGQNYQEMAMGQWSHQDYVGLLLSPHGSLKWLFRWLGLLSLLWTHYRRSWTFYAHSITWLFLLSGCEIELHTSPNGVTCPFSCLLLISIYNPTSALHRQNTTAFKSLWNRSIKISRPLQ